MEELTIRYDATGPRAVLAVKGPLDAQHCRLLREALDMARTIRPGKPMDIDLADVTRLGIAAQVCLAAAVRESRRTQRPLALRNLPPDASPALHLQRPERRTTLSRL